MQKELYYNKNIQIFYTSFKKFNKNETDFFKVENGPETDHAIGLWVDSCIKPWSLLDKSSERSIHKGSSSLVLCSVTRRLAYLRDVHPNFNIP